MRLTHISCVLDHDSYRCVHVYQMCILWCTSCGGWYQVMEEIVCGLNVYKQLPPCTKACGVVNPKRDFTINILKNAPTIFTTPFLDSKKKSLLCSVSLTSPIVSLVTYTKFCKLYEHVWLSMQRINSNVTVKHFNHVISERNRYLLRSYSCITKPIFLQLVKYCKW